MTGQIIKLSDRFNGARTELEQMAPEFGKALGKWIDPAYFIRVALTSIRRQPKLLECDRPSLMGALIEVAQLGLIPDGVTGQAYLVPFRVKGSPTCQLILGYRGLITLAHRSGFVNHIDGRAVYAKDEYDVKLGHAPKLHHIPHRGEDRGDLVAVYAVVNLRRGGAKFETMEAWEVDKIRDKSPGYRGQGANSPWVTHHPQMAIKTVLRRTCKTVPQGINDRLARAVTLDELADEGMDQSLETNVVKIPPFDPFAIEDRITENPMDVELIDPKVKAYKHASNCPAQIGEACECRGEGDSA